MLKDNDSRLIILGVFLVLVVYCFPFLNKKETHVLIVNTTVIQQSPHNYLDQYASPLSELSDSEKCLASTQCRTLAEAVFFEARGESEKGKFAVAFTVMNRRNSVHWPDTVKQVVYQKINDHCQYSYVCIVENKQRILQNHVKMWMKCLDVAYKVYNNKVDDFTKGSDHYFNPRKVKNFPKFAIVYKHTEDIGNHKFYRSNF
jgi:spore germination cell wall hydrolase CwlJ-like protein